MTGTVMDLLWHKKQGVFVVDAHCSVIAAVALMNEQNIGSVVVVERNKLLGIFTERDVLTRVVTRGRPMDTPVGDVMTDTPLTVAKSTLIADAMRTMSDKRCRHLPVMEGDELIALISAGDVLRHVIQGLESEVEDLRSYVQTAAVGYAPALASSR